MDKIHRSISAYNILGRVFTQQENTMAAKHMFQSVKSSNGSRLNDIESQEVLKALSHKLSLSTFASDLEDGEQSSKYVCVTRPLNLFDSSHICFRGNKRGREFDESFFILKRASPIMEERENEAPIIPPPKRIRSKSEDFEGREDESTSCEMRSESPNSPLLWEDLVTPGDDECYMFLADDSTAYN